MRIASPPTPALPHGRCQRRVGRPLSEEREALRPSRTIRTAPLPTMRRPRYSFGFRTIRIPKGLRMTPSRTPTEEELALAESVFGMFRLFRHVAQRAAQAVDLGSGERARILWGLKAGACRAGHLAQ